MKSSLILLMVIMIESTFSQPQLCSRINDYTSCTNTASLKIAACNGKVDNVPDGNYYDCLCNGHKLLMACYSIW